MTLAESDSVDLSRTMLKNIVSARNSFFTINDIFDILILLLSGSTLLLKGTKAGEEEDTNML